MLTFTEAQILAWITPVLWPFVRVLALFGTMPVLAQRSVPMRVRVARATDSTARTQESGSSTSSPRSTSPPAAGRTAKQAASPRPISIPPWRAGSRVPRTQHHSAAQPPSTSTGRRLMKSASARVPALKPTVVGGQGCQ